MGRGKWLDSYRKNSYQRFTHKRWSPISLENLHGTPFAKPLAHRRMMPRLSHGFAPWLHHLQQHRHE
jgi:hypothetical protein